MAGHESRMGNHVAEFVFPNGSKILFKGIDDWVKHKSLNLGFIAWDEADEFDEDTYQGMLSRVRQVDITSEARAMGYTHEITRNGMWMAFNPAGHNWIYKRFIDPKSKIKDKSWFRSTSFDNPFLPPSFIDSLLEYPEPWIRRYVLCQFDDFAGQIYEDWGWDSHVLAQPPELNGKEVVWMGMDPGMDNPTAGLWVVVDKENRRLVGIAEYQEKDLAAHRHALAWRRLEAQMRIRPAWRVADSNYITKRDAGTGNRLSEQYRRLGFRFSMGSNDPKITIPSLGNLIAQRRFVLSPTCAQTYEAIRDYKWEDLTPQQRAKGVDARERPLKKNTHLVECAQYLAGRYLRPLKVEPDEPDDDFSAEVHRAIKKQIMRQSLLPRQGDLGGVLV